MLKQYEDDDEKNINQKNSLQNISETKNKKTLGKKYTHYHHHHHNQKN